MADRSGERRARSRPCVRVGVTGHRDLGLGGERDPRVELLAGTVRQSLDRIRDLARAMHGDRGQQRVDHELRLQVISPLAIGADQLVAAHALTLGYELRVLLPFPQEIYEGDFKDADARRLHSQMQAALPPKFQAPDPLGGFRELLHAAGSSIIQIDGANGDPVTRDLSYLAAGRLVVRHSDVLIALWNGLRAGGTGGTGDIVDHALGNAIPVLWIDPREPARVRLLSHRDQLSWWHADSSGRDSGEGDEAYRQLDSNLRAVLLPSGGPSRSTGAQHSGGAPAGARRLHERLRALFDARSVASDTVAEDELPTRRLGLLFRLFYRFMSKPQHTGAEPGSVAQPDPTDAARGPLEIELYYDERYAAADRTAVRCGDYYRSAYLAIFVLGALALSSAVVAVAIHEVKTLFTVIELLLLAAILGIFLWERRHSWHRRWLASRLLAELFRPMRFLALLGRALPVAHGPAHGRSPGGEFEQVLSDFHGAVRDAPAHGLTIDKVWLERVRRQVVRDLIDDQHRYHEQTEEGCRRVAHRLLVFGAVLFVLAVVLVATKLGGLMAGAAWAKEPLLGVWAGILPAFGAAAFGIRQQAEFEVVERRSEAMQQVLASIRTRIDRLDLAVPCASEQLGHEIFLTAQHMVADLFEWATIFVVKPLETA